MCGAVRHAYLNAEVRFPLLVLHQAMGIVNIYLNILGAE
jgi:hypothetical protein